MMHKLLLIFFLVGISVSLKAQEDIIERDYFPGARAKNSAIAAARYAEEGYFYTKFTTFIRAVDSSRVYADTALFFIKRSLMLGDTALHYAPKVNYPAVDFLNAGIQKATKGDSIIRAYYPMSEIESHHVFGREASLVLSNSVMNFYNASLLLTAESDAPDSEAERYQVLPYGDEIIRLEVDETAFQQASNSYEHEMSDLEKVNKEIQAKIDATSDQKTRYMYRQKQELLDAQLTQNTLRLEDLSNRLEEIRQLLQNKHLSDVKDVEEPEHLPYFETASTSKVVEMDKDVPDGLVYKIQLGYYPSNVDIDNFHGLFPISGETVRANLARYFAGLFYSYKDATVGNKYVRTHAIANAFIVPFYNGEKISISSAVEIERNRGLK